MAFVRYVLGAPIALAPMIPLVPGVATFLPPGINQNHAEGLYLILNQQALVQNRYMGITIDFQTRFSARQGACFELGFARNYLNNINAYLGVMEYSNNGMAWSAPAGYDDQSLNIGLDGFGYDFEALFIKSAQHIWAHDTITNTKKTAALPNLGPNPINISISWLGVNAGNAAITIPVGGQLL